MEDASTMNPVERKLMDYMSELSEEGYYARWLMGLEHILWHAVINGPQDFGHLTITWEHIKKLKELSVGCGGWIIWDQEVDDKRFVPLGQWLNLYVRGPVYPEEVMWLIRRKSD